jgi:hypothetical protein
LKYIEDDNLVLNKRYQVIDIFASSLTPEHLTFSKRLSQQKINDYNFLLFSESHAEQLVFNINNLVLSSIHK